MCSRVVCTPNRRKTSIINYLCLPALTCAILILTHQPVAAQSCEISGLTNPSRQLISCGDGLVVEREVGTKITIVERQSNALPEAIELESGAIFIDVVSGSRGTQIRTPHAIAAVRGTTYVVDAGVGSTSIFVVEGAVEVRKANNPSTVTLGPGEGVDVNPEFPIDLKTWGANRVSELLARFGR